MGQMEELMEELKLQPKPQPPQPPQPNYVSAAELRAEGEAHAKTVRQTQRISWALMAIASLYVLWRDYHHDWQSISDFIGFVLAVVGIVLAVVLLNIVSFAISKRW